jgi:hypothetical protein
MPHLPGRERMLRWTLGSRRLRVDCTAGIVLGAAAVATGSFLAGALLIVVLVPIALWTAKAAVDQDLIAAFEREQEAKRMLARLEPELAAVVQERLGHEAAPIAWDTSSSIAPPA